MAWWISQPIQEPALDLTAEQLRFLRRTARKTWHFFETFVTEQENWLPPDNFQEVPKPIVASRTSPTNIGLSLLANLAARDFGYLPVGAVDRAHPKHASPPCNAWSGIAAIFTTGTTRAPFSRCCRIMCPAWTAAIWPAIC